MKLLSTVKLMKELLELESILPVLVARSTYRNEYLLLSKQYDIVTKEWTEIRINMEEI